jgi:hypothetical protein
MGSMLTGMDLRRGGEVAPDQGTAARLPYVALTRDRIAGCDPGIVKWWVNGMRCAAPNGDRTSPLPVGWFLGGRALRLLADRFGCRLGSTGFTPPSMPHGLT